MADMPLALIEPLDPKVCPHMWEKWPRNASWKVTKCDGDRDELICMRCGTITTARCNFDEEYS